MGCKYPPPPTSHEEREFLELLDRCKTQLRYKGGGMGPDMPYGFDYGACAPIIAAFGFDLGDLDFLDSFQILEDEFVAALSARIAKAVK